MKSALSLFLSFVIAAIVVVIVQYMFQLPLTFASLGTVVLYSIIFGIIFLITGYIISETDYDESTNILQHISYGLAGISTAVLVIALLIGLCNTPLFRAKKYSQLVDIQEGNFSQDIPEALDTDIMDIQTAINIGSRVIGEIDNVSQYSISDEYNMIKYQGKVYRVSPLEYSSFPKAWKNEGISGYVLVDCQTQEAKLVKLEDKIKYAPSATFGYKLSRHIRTNYPAAITGKPQFEIDEEGKPYYIVPTYKHTIGAFSGKVLDKILVVNCITGDIKEYTLDNVPDWIEHADSVDHLMELAKYAYMYKGGFWNSFMSQKDVKNLSYSYNDNSFIGYSSIMTNNGIEYFTGVTSANNDESILGFLFLNPKNGKTTFYSCVGAEEGSAQSSAEALVQNYGYTASYPFVVNVDGIETYLVALKDKTGVNKAYSFVNVKNYTIAAQSSSKEDALRQYKNLLKNNSAPNNDNQSEQNNTINGKIVNIYSVVENSTTYFYYQIEGHERLFIAPVTINRNQVLFKTGDIVIIDANLTNDGYYSINNISIKE